jgi:hypothetical protein
MKLLEFLEAVVPDGLLVAAKKVTIDIAGRPVGSMNHAIATGHMQLATAIVQLALDKKDTYFALASWKQGFHDDPTGKKLKDGRIKRVLRVGSNVDALKAIWFDLDFKDGYADAKAVVIALQAFCRDTGMPPPAILIHTGNGIHAYWPLSEAIPVARWQGLAQSLKNAALEKGLLIDPTCTADSCRVLRPPGTVNWKDPANPKKVKVAYSRDELFDPADLETLLQPYQKAVTTVSTAGGPRDAFNEFTGGVGKGAVKLPPANFETLQKHCAVAKTIADAHGKDSSEPEWVAMLQLLKFCEDADLWVHAVSDGHPGYDADATNEKWRQRMENTAGPTLCTTFEGYYPELCKKCPRNGYIKTPLQVGTEETTQVGGHPFGWRTSENGKFTERFMVIVNNEGAQEKKWIRVISYAFDNFRTTRSFATNQVEHRLDVPGVVSDLTIPGEALGNQNKLVEHMALHGVAFRGKEAIAFKELMASWLKTLQDAKHVAEVTEQLGWIVKDKTYEGFSAGATSFYADGRVRNDVRTAKEFAAVARYYEPNGDLEPWKRVAAFIAEQNNPTFTALVSSAFAAPILHFTGVSGGILSIVSRESGVGKSSALKASQAVWGSPTHAINAIDDTPKSVARKLGFLHNLPAYWDELRGKEAIQGFLTLAFQVTQGKEKTRLDQSASLREIHTWETMLIVASNDSIFDAMGSFSIGSDAGVARTFEVVVEPYKSASSRAEVGLLFEALNLNYGHAGRTYAQYLASNVDLVKSRVQRMRSKLGEATKERPSERFWLAMMASIIVGAQIAHECDLCHFDIRTLTGYLVDNMTRLRGRTEQSMASSDPLEILGTYIQQHQDKLLHVDKFPQARANTMGYMPEIIGGPPKSNKVIVHMARDDRRVRFARSDFVRWLQSRGMPESLLKVMLDELGGKETKALLGVGTAYEVPTRQRLCEFPITPSVSLDEVLDEVT